MDTALTLPMLPDSGQGFSAICSLASVLVTISNTGVAFEADTSTTSTPAFNFMQGCTHTGLKLRSTVSFDCSNKLRLFSTMKLVQSIILTFSLLTV